MAAAPKNVATKITLAEEVAICDAARRLGGKPIPVSDGLSGSTLLPRPGSEWAFDALAEFRANPGRLDAAVDAAMMRS